MSRAADAIHLTLPVASRSGARRRRKRPRPPLWRFNLALALMLTVVALVEVVAFAADGDPLSLVAAAGELVSARGFLLLALGTPLPFATGGIALGAVLQVVAVAGWGV